MKRPLVAAGVIAGVLSLGGIVVAGTMQFRAQPVTDFEVPTPVNVVGTPAADLKLKLSPDGQSLRYDLKITDPIQDVRQAHLHLGAPGSTGPIVVWLYPSAPPAQLIPGQTEGRLASGVITAANLMGPFGPTATTGPNWDGFIAALENGGLYANVHTSANLPGEIRDQVSLHGGHDSD